MPVAQSLAGSVQIKFQIFWTQKKSKNVAQILPASVAEDEQKWIPRAKSSISLSVVGNCSFGDLLHAKNHKINHSLADSEELLVLSGFFVPRSLLLSIRI